MQGSSHSLYIGLVLLYSVTLHAQTNNRPTVTITAPADNSSQALNLLIPYSITISDKEDGESIYGEISGQEVFLSVRYLPDPSRSGEALKSVLEPDPPGFVLLQKSNCANCHAFTGTLIGPSYAEITKRYPSIKENETLLVKRIREGSSGIWGGTAMPSHPELTPEAAQKIVTWILQNAGDPKTKYYVGLTGTLRLNFPQGDPSGGVFLLRASYTDHGTGAGTALQHHATAIIHTK